jgi:PAS domain-containing protein
MLDDVFDAKPDPAALIKAADPLAAMRHEGALTPPVRPWKDILLPNEMASEMLTRDGRFQIMISFMRIAPIVALVIDSTGRIIFMNAAAERYWKVRLWDVRGKLLADVMNMDKHETKTMSNEHASVLEPSCRGGAQVFFEHFRNGSERMSMLKFPFTEDDNYRLIGCFVLPSNASGDPKFGF